jgi:hypothetical protein
MKSIYTVVPDIYEQVQKKNGWFSDEVASTLSWEISSRLKEKFNEGPRTSTLRLSKMGPTCPKALWHSIHTPELAEPLPPWAEIKYTYGHIIECLAISLMKAAGHTVEGEQDEVILDTIIGHRDCVVDGCILDVKSCSSFSFDKFKSNSISQDDAFGYLDQLDGYVCACSEDPLVQVKDRGYILAIDKTLGKVHLYEHKVRPERIRKRIEEYKEIVRKNRASDCKCGLIAHGNSGNIRLDVKASYSPYKWCCFPELRCFLYATGPVYLTEVRRLPDVQEIDKHGKRIN